MSLYHLLSWRYCILVCGVGRSTNTGQYHQIQVSIPQVPKCKVLIYLEQCSAATNHLITNAVFNISSDLIILSIPMPLLFKVRLPRKNKIILFIIFCIGAFTIVAAALNKYYSFTHPFGNEWTIWYLRESYTAILCANLPLTYPLIQRVFGLRNWSSNTYEAENAYTVSVAQPQQSTQQHTRAYWPEPRAEQIPRGSEISSGAQKVKRT